MQATTFSTREVVKEYFNGSSDEEVMVKMRKRLHELERQGDIIRVERRKLKGCRKCPCGSGRKFSKCCKELAK